MVFWYQQGYNSYAPPGYHSQFDSHTDSGYHLGNGAQPQSGYHQGSGSHGKCGYQEPPGSHIQTGYQCFYSSHMSTRYHFSSGWKSGRFFHSFFVVWPPYSNTYGGLVGSPSMFLHASYRCDTNILTAFLFAIASM